MWARVNSDIYAAGHCLFQKYNHIPGGENFNNLKLHALLKDAILKWSISGKQQCIVIVCASLERRFYLS